MSLGVGLYVHGSVAAAALYCRAFGLTLGYHVLNEDGSYYHSELLQDGQPLVAVVEAPAAAAGCPVQLGYTFSTEAALRSAFDLLREGGSVERPVGPLPWSPCAAEVADRYGVRWYLSLPQHYPDADFRPEPEAGAGNGT